MKKLIVMIGAVAAVAMGAMAEITNTVKVTKFHQSYPYTGKATVEYTVGGMLPANAVAEITINTDDASATFTQRSIVAGANSHVIDFASSFGGALLLTNASFVVTIAENLGGVQLWEGGPYWAECNVGASKPEEYGYYFWWGDTVGYTRSGGTWTDDYYYSGVTWVSSAGQQMSRSPFSSSSCPTYDKDNSALQLAGYIDSTGNLVAAHDAATAHLGAQWRMPTDAEISALINNCTTTWITTNGVPGRLVTGKGAYADRSIFLPAAGDGVDSCLGDPGSVGNYWSSTPSSDFPGDAWYLDFDSGSFYRTIYYFYHGRSVRPVRGFATMPATMVTITFNANGGTVSPSSQSYAANGTYNSLPTPTYTGHTFTGWYTEASGGTQVASSSSAPASDTTLYAHWTANDPGDGGIGGIQLWENGPYWAECNVGASKPEEYGYYFWWGDTVGYTNTGSGWISVKDGTSISFTGSGTAASTYGKGNSALQLAGYIDSTGNLVAAHDAATAHLGAPWRMPTSDEIQALIDNCTTTWITTNGVNGRLVTGKDSYANRSIFLPDAGYGFDSDLGGPGSDGGYWSSTTDSDYSDGAWGLNFYPSYFGRNYGSCRYYGQSVRPVRGFATTPATMVTITFNANGGTVSPSSLSYVANGTYNSLPTPTYTGHTFTGWYTEASGGTQVASSSSVPASDTTLYAHWTANDPGDGGIGGIQLWEDGPYWAECNVGATKPEEYGYYFWWGDTVGYKRENDKWVATDGSSSNFSFSPGNTPTYTKGIATLQSEDWITADGVLAPAHDAAHVHWGGEWRMPTDQELSDLNSKCDWTWTTMNGVQGYLVKGKGGYTSASIFLPCAGNGHGTSLSNAGSFGRYWSSVPRSVNNYYCAGNLLFDSSDHGTNLYNLRDDGRSVRPVQGFTE